MGCGEKYNTLWAQILYFPDLLFKEFERKSLRIILEPNVESFD
jgi:hypothetical protein